MESDGTVSRPFANEFMDAVIRVAGFGTGSEMQCERLRRCRVVDFAGAHLGSGEAIAVNGDWRDAIASGPLVTVRARRGKFETRSSTSGAR